MMQDLPPTTPNLRALTRCSLIRRSARCEGEIAWIANPRRSNEALEAEYLFRIVRDVRNNLFHGGKFAGGPEPELARDRELIDAAVSVLEGAASLHPGIEAMLKEPA